MTHARMSLPVLLLSLAGGACGAGGDDAALDDARVQDGTPTWDVLHTDSSHLVIALDVVGESTVWAVGSRGLVGRTLDGGATWRFSAAPGGDSLGFRDVHAFSPTEAFILSIGEGSASRIYHTDDGGETWRPSFVNDDPNAFFDCFSFWDRERGIAFSDSHDGEFTLIRTLDGGRTWSRLDPATVPDARPGEGAFASSGACVVTRPGGAGWFVTGASGVDTRVIRTADYGDSWAEAPTPIASSSSTSGLFALSMRDDSVGVIVGGGLAPTDSASVTVALTRDGGASWTAATPHDLDGAAYGVVWAVHAPDRPIVAVGPSGSSVSMDGAASWSRLDERDYWTVTAGPDGTIWAGGRGHVSRLGGR